MKTLLLATVAAATIGLAVPANAQFYVGAEPGGVGVQVGPFGAGVGPRYWGHRHHRWDDSYAAYNYARDDAERPHDHQDTAHLRLAANSARSRRGAPQ